MSNQESMQCNCNQDAFVFLSTVAVFNPVVDPSLCMQVSRLAVAGPTGTDEWHQDSRHSSNSRQNSRGHPSTQMSYDDIETISEKN